MHFSVDNSNVRLHPWYTELMWTAGVAFGQRVAMLDHRGPAPTVPLRLLSPGDGTDLRRRATTARDRSEPIRDVRHREVLVPGHPSFAQRVRVDMLGVDPQAVHEPGRFRLFDTDRADTRRYAVLGEWSAWRQQVDDLLETVPDPATAGGGDPPAPLESARWAAVLTQRPALRDAPTGGGIPSGLGSWRAQALLDSIAARAVVIAALPCEQYADAAELAETYPENQEFLTAEVSLALQIPESGAAALICTGTHLAGRLPATLAACRAGQITAEAAQVILGATAVVTDPTITAAVEAAVLPHTKWKAREGLRRRVVREVIRHDPDGADRRHAAARKQRCVSKWSDVDGMGWLKLHAAAQDIAAVWEAITALAQAAKTRAATPLGISAAPTRCATCSTRSWTKAGSPVPTYPPSTGQIDRAVGPGQCQVLHPLAVGDDPEAVDVGSSVAAVEHLLRRIDPFDVNTASGKLEERSVVAAAEFQRRLAGPMDEFVVAVGVNGATKRRIYIRNDAGMEIRSVRTHDDPTGCRCRQ